jgi:hypothetical protein
VAPRPGQPDQSGPGLSPVLKPNGPPTLLGATDPMAALAAKYRAPDPANQGGSSSCGTGGCPTPPPAVPAPGAPIGPTNAGGGTGTAGVPGGAGPARLAGTGALTNPDGTPLAGSAPARGLLDPTRSPGGARGPPPGSDPLAGVPGVPQLAGPGQGGLTPWAQAYNDSPVGQAITRTVAPGSMIPGVIGQVNKNFAQGPIDGLANAGYEGTAVTLHPGTAAQDSTGRWSNALDGHPGQLLNDYWNHPGQSLAEDTQTLTQAHPTLTRMLTTAAAGTSLGSAASILTNPVGAAYVGDTAGGLAHLGYTETRRWGPVLAAAAPGGAAVMTAAGTDPLANVKADYNRDPAGALTQDLTTAGTIAGGFAGGAEAGAAEAGAGEAGAAARAGMAETGTGAQVGPETGGLAGRAATGQPRAQAPSGATGAPAPADRPIDRTPNPTADTPPARSELTSPPAGQPIDHAGIASHDAPAASHGEPAAAESLPITGRPTPTGTPAAKPDGGLVDSSPTPSVNRSPLIDEPHEPPVLDLYHGTAARHAQTIRQDGIDLTYGRPDSDFGKGFYVTNNLDQAVEWMKHQTRGEPGEVLHYRVPADELQKLHGQSFAGPDAGWQDLVRGMRSQTDPMHPYDWVEGPLLLNPRDFVAGKPPVTGGHQISVHTPDAVDLLNRSLTDHDASH